MTLTPFDTLKGGSAVDTLNATFNAEVTTLSNVRVDGVENINFTTDAAFTASLNHWGGVQKVNVASIGTAAKNVSLTSKATDVSVLGGSGVTILDTDSSGAGANLQSVAIDAATSTLTLKGAALTDVTLMNIASADADLTITNATVGHAQNLTLNNISAAIDITSTAAANVNITTTGKEASVLGALDISAATTLNISGDAKLSMTTLTATALTDVVVTNTAGVNLGTTALAVGANFTGGTGNDAVTIGATTKAVDMGNGNDTVTLGVAALGAGGTVKGGEGTDTLVMTTTNAAAAASTATLDNVVTGFEVLQLTKDSGDKTVSLAAFNDAGHNAIHKVILGTYDDSLTLNGLQSNDIFEFAGAMTAGKTTTLGVTDAATSTANVLNIGITAGTALDVKTIAANGVETINFLTDSTASPVASIAHTATLTDAAAKSITVSGDAGLTLTFTGTALTNFDASGVTSGKVTWTSGALDHAATVLGAASTTESDFTFTDATKAVTFTGVGEGADKITIGSANSQANIIATGAGIDEVILTSSTGKNVVDLGAGNDKITLGESATVHLGAGNDVVTVSVISAVGKFSTITDFSKGDTIKLGSSANALAHIDLGANVEFATLVKEACKTEAADTTNVLSWFTFGGQNYLVLDAATTSNTDYVATSDMIVCVGTTDLTGATVTGGILSLA